MKYIRFKRNDEIMFGTLEDNQIRILDKSFLEENCQPTGDVVDLHEVKLLAPVLPSKVLCVGLNYIKHVEEMKNELPEKSPEPIVFMKPTTSIIGPNDAITLPEISQRVEYEGELAVVVGKTLRKASEDEIKESIFGYTCANDVTARDLQKKDGQWTRAKGFDTFCPLGPWIETELNPLSLDIKTVLNNEIKQLSNTKYLMTPIYKLIAFMSEVMTINPGDVILTGTPEGVGPMHHGDEIKVEIEGIGILRNIIE